jgi:hypothetical protein
VPVYRPETGIEKLALVVLPKLEASSLIVSTEVKDGADQIEDDRCVSVVKRNKILSTKN